ncbi:MULTISPECIES: conjugative transposon protein TraK [Algoriphagus]|jgi:conjugative transposon TraK protein|uniref:Conjugative transposon TraK protein n=2 Tax=Algoriphagus TaxID=246875 RepID=A0A841MJ85_9BACT|nr:MULTISPECIES: conjugative transposon protein TraK [Algoriphagus]MBB6326953.1 conjugative transposon TraK protein [Algoriphagus iocasae]SMP17041.1 Bacteroides conjugative transposon TraK protein [Algoriphagus winogradskyi]
MIIKNIESKIRLATILSIGSFLTSIIICGFVSAYAYQQVANARQSIYILDNDIPILAKQTNMQMNRPAEYKAAVDLFHSLFFNLTPDDKHIEYQMEKAMYFVDETGVGQYNNLKEKGYFNSILSSSSVLSIQTDSIVIDQNRFRYYGKQKIDRRSATITRSIVTEGDLIDIPRSENNSHGVLITNWKTIENKDLSNVSKNTF